MPQPLTYTIILEPLAQDWLSRQSTDTQKRVWSILNTFAQFAGRSDQALQLQGPRWFDAAWGWARRIKMDSVQPGLRCIYFAWVERQEMIVIKFGTHADDVYEDSN